MIRTAKKGKTCEIALTSFALAHSRTRAVPIWNRRGCSSEILNLTPKGDHLGVAQAFCDP